MASLSDHCRSLGLTTAVVPGTKLPPEGLRNAQPGRSIVDDHFKTWLVGGLWESKGTCWFTESEPRMRGMLRNLCRYISTGPPLQQNCDVIVACVF